MSDRILFLDIDGPLIPSRAYEMPSQTHNPFVTIFDPCAVGMINKACEKQDRKIVLHSSWIRTAHMYPETLNMDVREWCIHQGIHKSLFHEDAYCNRETSWRYDRIGQWLQDHPGTNDFVILDDEAPEPTWHYKRNVLLIDFENGITMKDYHKLLDGDWRL